jgi:hypothetical protein
MEMATFLFKVNVRLLSGHFRRVPNPRDRLQRPFMAENYITAMVVFRIHFTLQLSLS